MPKLYRPHIPVEVRCRVALRQLGEMWPDKVIEENRPKASASYLAKAGLPPGRSLGRLLAELLDRLADLLGCNVTDLRLDHDPALGARPQERRGLGRKTYYVPDANDPEHLFYRPHGPQFEGSHLIKTNTRGDHGQYPDRVLIKRERKRREARNNSRNKKPIFNSGKSKWPKGRKLQGRSSWQRRAPQS